MREPWVTYPLDHPSLKDPYNDRMKEVLVGAFWVLVGFWGACWGLGVVRVHCSGFRVQGLGFRV